MNTVLGIMSDEDLSRYRISLAKMLAVESKPDAYGAADIEQAYMGLWRMQGEVLNKFGVDAPGNGWAIDHVTGKVGYEE